MLCLVYSKSQDVHIHLVDNYSWHLKNRVWLIAFFQITDKNYTGMLLCPYRNFRKGFRCHKELPFGSLNSLNQQPIAYSIFWKSDSPKVEGFTWHIFFKYYQRVMFKLSTKYLPNDTLVFVHDGPGEKSPVLLKSSMKKTYPPITKKDNSSPKNTSITIRPGGNMSSKK